MEGKTKKKRRSSILKKSPHRKPLIEQDTAPIDDERRRRVSFAQTYQVKEISRVADIADKWPEANKDIDTTNIGDISNLTQNCRTTRQSSRTSVQGLNALLSAPLFSSTPLNSGKPNDENCPITDTDTFQTMLNSIPISGSCTSSGENPNVPAFLKDCSAGSVLESSKGISENFPESVAIPAFLQNIPETQTSQSQLNKTEPLVKDDANHIKTPAFLLNSEAPLSDNSLFSSIDDAAYSELPHVKSPADFNETVNCNEDMEITMVVKNVGSSQPFQNHEFQNENVRSTFEEIDMEFTRISTTANGFIQASKNKEKTVVRDPGMEFTKVLSQQNVPQTEIEKSTAYELSPATVPLFDDQRREQNTTKFADNEMEFTKCLTNVDVLQNGAHKAASVGDDLHGLPSCSKAPKELNRTTTECTDMEFTIVSLSNQMRDCHDKTTFGDTDMEFTKVLSKVDILESVEQKAAASLGRASSSTDAQTELNMTTTECTDMDFTTVTLSNQMRDCQDRTKIENTDMEFTKVLSNVNVLQTGIGKNTPGEEEIRLTDAVCDNHSVSQNFNSDAIKLQTHHAEEMEFTCKIDIPSVPHSNEYLSASEIGFKSSFQEQPKPIPLQIESHTNAHTEVHPIHPGAKEPHSEYQHNDDSLLNSEKPSQTINLDREVLTTCTAAIVDRSATQPVSSEQKVLDTVNVNPSPFKISNGNKNEIQQDLPVICDDQTAIESNVSDFLVVGNKQSKENVTYCAELDDSGILKFEVTEETVPSSGNDVFVSSTLNQCDEYIPEENIFHQTELVISGMDSNMDHDIFENEGPNGNNEVMAVGLDTEANKQYSLGLEKNTDVKSRRKKTKSHSKLSNARSSIALYHRKMSCSSDNSSASDRNDSFPTLMDDSGLFGPDLQTVDHAETDCYLNIIPEGKRTPAEKSTSEGKRTPDVKQNKKKDLDVSEAGAVDNQRKRNYDDAELFEKTDKSNASESKQFKLAESSEEDNLEDDSAAICQNNEEVQNTLEVKLPTEDTELSEVSTVTAKASSMDIDDFLEKYTDIKMGDTKLASSGRESGIAHGPTKKPDTIGELVSRIFMHAKNLPIYADFIESIENKVNSLKEELESQKSFICQNNPEIMTKIQSAPENEVWLLKDNLEHLAESSKQLAQAQWQCVKSKLYKSLTMSMNMTIDSDIQTIVDQVFHFGNPQELLLAATQHLEAENHKLELETKEMAEKGELPSTETTNLFIQNRRKIEKLKERKESNVELREKHERCEKEWRDNADSLWKAVHEQIDLKQKRLAVVKNQKTQREKLEFFKSLVPWRLVTDENSLKEFSFLRGTLLLRVDVSDDGKVVGYKLKHQPFGNFAPADIAIFTFIRGLIQARFSEQSFLEIAPYTSSIPKVLHHISREAEAGETLYSNIISVMLDVDHCSLEINDGILRVEFGGTSPNLCSFLVDFYFQHDKKTELQPINVAFVESPTNFGDFSAESMESILKNVPRNLASLKKAIIDMIQTAR